MECLFRVKLDDLQTLRIEDSPVVLESALSRRGAFPILGPGDDHGRENRHCLDDQQDATRPPPAPGGLGFVLVDHAAHPSSSARALLARLGKFMRCHIGLQAGPLPTVVHLETLLVFRQRATGKAWRVSTRHHGEDLVAQTGVVRTEPRQHLTQGHITLDERVGLAGHLLSGTARCNEQPTEIGVGHRQ